jgi:hypothetical protein
MLLVCDHRIVMDSALWMPSRKSRRPWPPPPPAKSTCIRTELALTRTNPKFIKESCAEKLLPRKWEWSRRSQRVVINMKHIRHVVLKQACAQAKAKSTKARAKAQQQQQQQGGGRFVTWKACRGECMPMWIRTTLEDVMMCEARMVISYLRVLRGACMPMSI